jgi:hypothetical protein
MPTLHDLSIEERTMATMSLGDHIEELRRHLILALLGLFVGVVVTLLYELGILLVSRSRTASRASSPKTNTPSVPA